MARNSHSRVTNLLHGRQTPCIRWLPATTPSRSRLLRVAAPALLSPVHRSQCFSLVSASAAALPISVALPSLAALSAADLASACLPTRVAMEWEVVPVDGDNGIITIKKNSNNEKDNNEKDNSCLPVGNYFLAECLCTG